MERKTHYEVLGVHPRANPDKIAKAYKLKLDELRARLDAGDDSVNHEIFALRESYSALSNQAKRDDYDEMLARAMFNGGDGSKAPGQSAEPVAEPERASSDHPSAKPTENPKLMACPTCGGGISKTAKSCPHCGEMLVNETTQPARATPPKNAGCLAMTGYIFIGLIVVGFIGNLVGGGKSGSSGAASNREIDSFVMCKQFVEQRLKAPSTAEFPWSGKGVSIGGSTYVVRSYVDAQNGFGAMIRTHYMCKVKHMGGDRWQLLELEM